MTLSLPTGTATLLFTDIEGPTRLLRAMGRQVGELLAWHWDVVHGVWAEHTGTVVDAEREAFFLALGSAPAGVAAAPAAAEGNRASLDRVMRLCRSPA